MSQPTHQRERKSAAPMRQAKPRAGVPHPALALMDQFGNRGLSALRGRLLQRKAEGVSVPADPLEVVADRVADRVLGAPVGTASPPPEGTAAPGSVQRNALPRSDAPRGAGMPHLPGPPAPSESTQSAVGPAPRSALAGALLSRLDAGRPIPTDTRHFMEDRFARSFEDVRIHTGDKAASAARSIAANAFTIGSEIVFGKGRWVPETREGKRLLAHELAHVVQQGGKRGALAPESVSEGEADCVGHSVVEGRAADVSACAALGAVQRDPQMTHEPSSIITTRYVYQGDEGAISSVLVEGEAVAVIEDRAEKLSQSWDGEWQVLTVVAKADYWNAKAIPNPRANVPGVNRVVIKVNNNVTVVDMLPPQPGKPPKPQTKRPPHAKPPVHKPPVTIPAVEEPGTSEARPRSEPQTELRPPAETARMTDAELARLDLNTRLDFLEAAASAPGWLDAHFVERLLDSTPDDELTQLLDALFKGNGVLLRRLARNIKPGDDARALADALTRLWERNRKLPDDDRARWRAGPLGPPVKMTRQQYERMLAFAPKMIRQEIERLEESVAWQDRTRSWRTEGLGVVIDISKLASQKPGLIFFGEGKERWARTYAEIVSGRLPVAGLSQRNAQSLFGPEARTAVPGQMEIEKELATQFQLLASRGRVFVPGVGLLEPSQWDVFRKEVESSAEKSADRDLWELEYGVNVWNKTQSDVLSRVVGPFVHWSAGRSVDEPSLILERALQDRDIALKQISRARTYEELTSALAYLNLSIEGQQREFARFKTQVIEEGGENAQVIILGVAATAAAFLVGPEVYAVLLPVGEATTIGGTVVAYGGTTLATTTTAAGIGGFAYGAPEFFIQGNMNEAVWHRAGEGALRAAPYGLSVGVTSSLGSAAFAQSLVRQSIVQGVGGSAFGMSSNLVQVTLDPRIDFSGGEFLWSGASGFAAGASGHLIAGPVGMRLSGGSAWVRVPVTSATGFAVSGGSSLLLGADPRQAFMYGMAGAIPMPGGGRLKPWRESPTIRLLQQGGRGLLNMSRPYVFAGRLNLGRAMEGTGNVPGIGPPPWERASMLQYNQPALSMAAGEAMASPRPSTLISATPAETSIPTLRMAAPKLSTENYPAIGDWMTVRPGGTGLSYGNAGIRIKLLPSTTQPTASSPQVNATVASPSYSLPDVLQQSPPQWFTRLPGYMRRDLMQNAPAIDSERTRLMAQVIRNYRRNQNVPSRVDDPESVSVAVSGGTVAVSQTDIPTLQDRTFPGASAQALPQGLQGAPGTTGGRTLIPANPTAIDHAEHVSLENLRLAIVQAIQQRRIVRADLRGRTVFVLVEQEPCASCAAGAGGGRAGILQQFSELYPELTVEVRNLRTSRTYIYREGRLINP